MKLGLQLKIFRPSAESNQGPLDQQASTKFIELPGLVNTRMMYIKRYFTAEYRQCLSYEKKLC